MEKKIIRVSVSEIVIEFALNTKCRANVGVTSLCDTEGVAFKVQTSSPNKFLVNPPSGLIPPLSTINFQIVLKPQSQLPCTYPRSPSDRFLIRAAKLTSSSLTPHQSIASWLSSQPLATTQDVKLKVAFVGPILLQHAISCGDTETVNKLIKRRDSFRHDHLTSSNDEAPLVISESSLNDVQKMNVCATSRGELLYSSEYTEEEQGEAVLNAARRGESEKLKSLLSKGATPRLADQYGFTALHIAALKGHNQVIQLLLDLEDGYINSRDGEGKTPLHLAVEGGCPETVELLITRGADINSASTTGATPMHIARAMGYDSICWMLQKRGALLYS